MSFFISGNRPTEDIVKKISEPEGMFDISFTKANKNFLPRVDYNDDDCYLNASKTRIHGIKTLSILTMFCSLLKKHVYIFFGEENEKNEGSG